MKRIKKEKKVGYIKGTNKLDIDEEQVERLAEKFWANTEIAAFFGVDEKTIRSRFPNLLIKGREKGKAKLRDLQLKSAMSGNVTMLIWLGKQYLQQREPEKEQPPEGKGLPEFEGKSDEELESMIDQYQGGK